MDGCDYGYSNAWVYVQVHNKSCVTYNPSGTERLAVYWTRASTNASWTAGNFTDPTFALGHEVNSAQIPTLAPGESAVIELEWDIANVNAQLGENMCLLARIENIGADPITNHPNFLGNDVYFNNNIAMKNLTVVNQRPKYFGGVTMPQGGRVFIGEPNDEPNVYDVKFGTTSWLGVDEDLFESAEVTFHVDQSFWDVANNSPQFQLTGIEIVNDEKLKILNADAAIEGLSFQPNERVQIYVGFSFLTDYLTDDTTNFTFHIRQFEAEGEERATGAVHYDVIRLPRDYFEADAGGDQDMYEGESVTMSASPINEPATYNWYRADTLYYSGGSLTDSPDTTTEYTLEVVADDDNYKDYDKVTVSVKHRWITNLYPNPASGLIALDYDLEGGIQSAQFNIINNNGLTSLSNSLSLSANSIPVDISSLSPGIYNLQLIADGVLKESRILVIQ